MKKRNLKFNVLDSAIIILLVLFLLGSFANAQLKSMKIFRGKEKNVVVSVEVIDKSKQLSESLKVGEKVYLADSGKCIGTITAVVDKSNKNYVPEGDKFNIVFTDDLYRVLIKFDATVYENENGLFLKGNRFVASGAVLDLKTPRAVFSGTVSDIKSENPS